MSRVLLFTRKVGGQPKCAWRCSRGVIRTSAFVECVAALRDGLSVLHGPGEVAAAVAYEWWLVECENADAGRACIALAKASGWLRTEFNDDAFVDGGTVEVRGRILASGGRHA
jgi:hypothetical protein